MKFLWGQLLSILLSVIILYYLLNTSNFLPYLTDGSINWQNVVVLTFFVCNILVSIVSVIYILVVRFILRQGIDRKVVLGSLKIGLVFALGIVAAFILNFLHILNIYYGFGVVGLVIIILLII